MIKISEICRSLANTLIEYKNGNYKSKELKSYYARLNNEICGVCTDLDLVLIELRGNLKKHFTQTFKDDLEKLNSLRIIVRKFVKDLKSTEVSRFMEIAAELEELL